MKNEPWKVLPLGEVGRFRGGTGFPTKYQGAQNGPVPFFKVSDMNLRGNEKVMATANNYIEFDQLSILGAKLFDPETIIFAKVGAAIFLERKRILAVSSCLDNNLVGFTLNDDLDNPDFYHHWFTQTKLAELVATTALPSINNKQLQSLYAPKPPKAEQDLIAALLNLVDDFLNSIDALIAKKRDIKQGAMQQLLTGKTRLPGFSDGWKISTLGDLFTIESGKSKASHLSDSGRYVVVDMGGIAQDGALSARKRTNLSEDVLAAGALVMPKDDIGGGKIIGKAAHIPIGGKYVLGDHVYLLTSKGCDSKFLSYLINSETVNQELRSKVVGSAQLGLGRKSVTSQGIRYPEIDEQRAIADILSDMDAEIDALVARREKTSLTKTGMMQELLTGSTRLL